MPQKTKNKKQKNSSAINVVDMDKKSFENFAGSVASPWRVFLLGFLRGAGFSLGTLIGGAILLTIITYLLSVLVQIPFVGDWVRNIVDSISLNING